MNQTTIFDMMYPRYKITKPLRVITLFSGYDSQCLALNYLGIKYEHWRTCEWAVKSIQALKDIHFNNEKIIMASGNQTPERIYNILYAMGISQNYNEPMKLEQIKRLGYDKARQILENIHITHNLVNIQQVKANDLGIENTNLFTYLLTYSFPCQDLSSAGLRKGMSDTSTRSGMLWEVERILNECKENNKMPEILLMENVPDIHNYQNIADFHKWQVKLEELGYKSYWQDLNATDYGIPQSRNRCFMVSILGNYSYTFPKPIPLKLKLKDMLEEEVEEKYYLSDKIIKFYCENTIKQQENENGFKFKPIEQDKAIICKTITTRSGSRMDDNYIINKPLFETLNQSNNKVVENCSYIDSYNKTIRSDGLIGTLTTRIDASNLYYLYKDLRIRKRGMSHVFVSANCYNNL